MVRDYNAQLVEGEPAIEIEEFEGYLREKGIVVEEHDSDRNHGVDWEAIRRHREEVNRRRHARLQRERLIYSGVLK
jgi:molybdate-binding protein